MPLSAACFAHWTCCSACRTASSSFAGTNNASACFSGNFNAAFIARMRVTASSIRSGVRMPFAIPSFMKRISSSKSLLNRKISQPAAIAVGTAKRRSIAAQKPTIGVASLVMTPLNPSSSRNSSCMITGDKVAGRKASSSDFWTAGKAIWPIITDNEPASMRPE